MMHLSHQILNNHQTVMLIFIHNNIDLKSKIQILKEEQLRLKLVVNKEGTQHPIHHIIHRLKIHMKQQQQRRQQHNHLYLFNQQR